MNRAKGYLLVLVLVFAYLSLQLALPFLQYVLGAILIAYVLHPLHLHLESRTSPAISAASLVLLAVVAFVLPFVFVTAVIAGDLMAIAEGVDPQSLGIAELEGEIQEQTGVEVDVVSHLTNAAQQAGSIVLDRWTEWVSTFTHVLIGLGLALFLLYYLLRDGRRLVSWLRGTTPLPDDVQDDLYTELDEVMRAVLMGHVLIAIVQGVIAGLGLFATGVPSAAFWTIVMIVLALVPLIGAFLVWGPAVGYLLVTGEPVLAAGLFLYSAVVVGVSDDYLRPLVVDRYAELSPAIIILGVLGGVYAFGVMGLFFGPVILGAFKATLTVVDEHYERLEDGSSPS